MSASLRIVTPEAPAQTSTSMADLSARIRQLQAETRALAAEQVDSLVVSLRQTQRLAEEVSAGGEAYPAGVRDLARRLAEEITLKVQTMETLMTRA